MKKIVILIFFLSFASNGQNNMQFNRVLDTIMVVNVNTPTDISTSPIYGNSLSPNANKIWKIQHIDLARNRQSNILYCNENTNYSSSGLIMGLLINDGANEVVLCETTFASSTEASYPRLFEDGTTCNVNFPFWLNSGSSISPVLYLNANANSQLCVSDVSGEIYISILEFIITD